MFIQTEAMPDQSRMKFFPGEIVLTAGSAEFLNQETAQRSPLASRLFEVEGVKAVMLYTDFIAITKQDTFDWQLLKPLILGSIMDHYTAGDPIILPTETEDESELEAALEALFEPREEDAEPFLPYLRNEDLARPWAIPGTKGLEHRIGGLEKQENTGNVSYDPDNHQRMCELRDEKVQKIAEFIPEQEVSGEQSGDVLVLSWGGTYGACVTAVTRCVSNGLSVGHAHLRHLCPFPRNLETILGNFKKVLIPELNLGQLNTIIRSEFLLEAETLNKVKGRPFTVTEIEAKIRELL